MTATATALKAEPQFDPSPIPSHVAIIMDGNGRWAAQHGKERLEGHWQGYRTLKDVVYAAAEIGIGCLTVYCFSTENWRRPQDEVHGLMRLMHSAMIAEIEELIEQGIRIRVSGRLDEVPEDVREAFLDASQRTQGGTGMIFNLALNYGGRAEIVDAVRKIAQEALSGNIDPDTIDERAISQRLYHPDIPDPDLLIRTAGEMRLSNFLLWETAYSEIYVTEACWPDFGPSELQKAIDAYSLRTRKFGRVV